MRTKHTPGPWNVYEQSIEDAEAAKRELCALVDGTPKVGPTLFMLCAPNGLSPAVTGCGECADANARLIAAAPDMLRMLRSLLRTVSSMGGDLKVTAPESINANTYEDELRRINALIAKAEGTSNA
jgi:hypothetical protein